MRRDGGLHRPDLCGLCAFLRGSACASTLPTPIRCSGARSIRKSRRDRASSRSDTRRQNAATDRGNLLENGPEHRLGGTGSAGREERCNRRCSEKSSSIRDHAPSLFRVSAHIQFSGSADEIQQRKEVRSVRHCRPYPTCRKAPPWDEGGKNGLANSGGLRHDTTSFKESFHGHAPPPVHS